MKLLSHRRLRPDQHRRRRPSRKLLKKMAKLEKKLSEYFVADAESDRESVSSRDGGRSRSRSRPRRGRRRCGRSPSSASSSSSSSSSSDDSSSDSSSSSSRSPSPHGRRCRGQTRSRSFAGHGKPGHHLHRRCRRHHHSHSPQRGAHSWLRHYRGRHQPNQPDASPHLDREPLDPGRQPVNGAAEPSRELDQAQTLELVDQVELGPPLDEGLAKIWSKIIREGMAADEKEALLRKYPASEALKGPRLNEELVPLLPRAVLEGDAAQMRSQEQIGSTLTALGLAMAELNDKPELQNDEKLVDILESLNAAAALILELHREVTSARRQLVLSSLNKRVRSVVEGCAAADGFLFATGLAEKIEKFSSRGKGRKSRAKSDDEGNKRKRKGHDRESIAVVVSDRTGRVGSRDQHRHRHHHHPGSKNIEWET